MNLTPHASRFRRPLMGLMRSHLAPCRPLRSLRLAQSSAVRGAPAVGPETAAHTTLAVLEPRRV